MKNNWKISPNLLVVHGTTAVIIFDSLTKFLVVLGLPLFRPLILHRTSSFLCHWAGSYILWNLITKYLKLASRWRPGQLTIMSKENSSDSSFDPLFSSRQPPLLLFLLSLLCLLLLRLQHHLSMTPVTSRPNMGMYDNFCALHAG